MPIDGVLKIREYTAQIKEELARFHVITPRAVDLLGEITNEIKGLTEEEKKGLRDVVDFIEKNIS